MAVNTYRDVFYHGSSLGKRLFTTVHRCAGSVQISLPIYTSQQDILGSHMRHTKNIVLQYCRKGRHRYFLHLLLRRNITVLERSLLRAQSFWSYLISQSNKTWGKHEEKMSFSNPDGGSWRRKQKKQEILDDAALAAELNQLSVKEREHIYEVVHGVAETRLQETPEFVESKMKELKEELSKLSKRRRRDYDRALFLKPSLANDANYHLMFLRADRFNCQKAAIRLCKFHSKKLELFGDERLAKSLTLDDLDEDDMESLRHGFHQVIDQPDRSGRRVWISSFRRIKYKHLRNIVSFLVAGRSG